MVSMLVLGDPEEVGLQLPRQFGLLLNQHMFQGLSLSASDVGQ